MTPDNVRVAKRLLDDLYILDCDIDSIKSRSLTIQFSGKYHGEDTEIQDAARVGLLKLYYERRATKIAELRALGVEIPE